MSEPKRLFFALELPTTVREEIIQWRAAHFPPEAGRPVAAENLHLTLAFLGDVSADKQQETNVFMRAVPRLQKILSIIGNQ